MLKAGPKLSKAVDKICIIRAPDFDGEGFNGYIETDIEAEIKDLQEFTTLYSEWYYLPDSERIALYKEAKGN